MLFAFAAFLAPLAARAEKANVFFIHGANVSENDARAWAAVLTDVDSEIAVSEKKVEKYRQLKSGMMSELLTGKVRLSEGK